ncbi:MAG: hypothetical protein IJM15_05410 [Erysipelotrichaceae bacterium]|nr:hypothetical protein [Erysipelotrichaceae bacterium]
MKKKKFIIIALLLAIMILIGLKIYKPAGKTGNTEIVSVSSQQFSAEDFEKATEAIKKYFSREFRDCELIKLEYVGDEANSSVQYEYLKDQYGIDEWIVFNMVFKVGKRYNPSYNSNSTQEMKIIFGRKTGEDWKYLDAGRP